MRFNFRLLVAGFIGVILCGCSKEPPNDARTEAVQGAGRNEAALKRQPSTVPGSSGLKQSSPAGSRMTPEKTQQAIGNIRSFLVDLEGELRVGPAETWKMKAAAAGHVVRQMNRDVDVIANGQADVAQLRTQLSVLADSIATANEKNWNRVVSDGQSAILELVNALSKLEKQAE